MKKRICMAVMAVRKLKDVEEVRICGITALEKPSPTYVPLCSSHRTMAEIAEVKVFIGDNVGDYRITKEEK